MATKYKNIVGSAFLPHIKKQFDTRSSIVKKKTRSNSDLQYLTNRNAWFRLSSSAETTTANPPTPEKASTVNVTTSDLAGGIGSTAAFDFNQSAQAETDIVNAALLENFNNSFSGASAKNNVLQGGTIISGDNNSTTLRKGFKNTYSKGPTDDLGLRPMPGITGITIGTGGKWQTLMQADVEFICYDLDQLNEMSKLYMSLGVTCFLEWGHVPYLDNSGKLISQNPNLDFFGEKDKNQLIKSIAKKRESTGGNYDGFVGTVYNFSYQGDKDGAYLCKVQLMGAGGMVESLKINTAFNIDFTNASDSNASEDYLCTLDNALASLSQFLRNKNSKIFETNATEGVTFGKIDDDEFFKIFDKSFPGKVGVNRKWGDLLNKIYGSASYTPFNFSEDGKVSYTNNSPAEFGNAHQIISGIVENGNDGLEKLPLKFYTGFAGEFPGAGNNSWRAQNDDYQTYITFGHLLTLINSLGIFVESKTKKLDKDASPVLYIDYHPDNTIIDIAPIVATVNPFKCIVPFEAITPYSDYFNPLPIDGDEKWWWQSSLEVEGVKSHNLSLPDVSNKINVTYPTSEFIDSKTGGGKLMNVLINIDFARGEMRNSLENNNVNLIKYLTKLLEGINESLGGVNNLRPFIDECGTILRIVDEKVINPTIIREEVVEIPTFGNTSIAYDASYSSAITPKLSSQIVIATQAQGGGIQDFSEDVLSYQSLNAGIKDRFSSYKFPSISKPSKNTAVEDKAKYVKSLLKLYDHIWSIYSTEDTKFTPADCGNMLSSYIDLSNQTSKKTFTSDANQNKNKSSILIPLEYTVSIDGIGGILPYNAFKIPDNRLPERYRGRVAFAVFSINHSFENNSWLTTLRGQTIMLETIKSLSTSSKISGDIKVAPREETEVITNFPKETLTGITTTEKEVTYTEIDSPGGTTENSNATPPSPVLDAFTVIPTNPNINVTPLAPRAQYPPDIIAAAQIIPSWENYPNESTYEPYKDTDYTVSEGFKWRIGFGTETITRNGTFRAVLRSDKITNDEAYDDFYRLITTVTKPFVVSKLQGRGIDYNTLDVKVQVIFLDIAYNYGGNHRTLYNSFINAYIADGKQGLINELQRRADLGPNQVPSRRLKEIGYLKT